MKKKNVYSLDDDDMLGPSQDGTALLMFHSVTPNYAFVDDLNKLYRIELQRIDDMEMDGSMWPMFSYHDELLRLTYYLAEKPLAASGNTTAWTPGHKLLIIMGDRAEETADAIHQEFSTGSSNADPADILAAEHNELLNEMVGNFTTTSIIDTAAPLPDTMTKKKQQEYNKLYALVNDILDYIDIKYIFAN